MILAGVILVYAAVPLFLTNPVLILNERVVSIEETLLTALSAVSKDKTRFL
jgi:hypothetical protein